MPKYRLIILLCLTIPVYTINGLCQALRLNTDVVDFGKISSVNLIPKSVRFRNSSDKDLAILLVKKGPNVKMHYSHRFFHAGETGIITFVYDPRTTGSINEDVKLYTNLDNQPVTIHLKGNVVSVLECFPDPHNILKREIHVIDKITKAPVPQAKIDMVHNHNENSKVDFRVNNEGKIIRELPIGLYDAGVTAANYQELTKEFFLPKSQPYVIFELKPVVRQDEQRSRPEMKKENRTATVPVSSPVPSMSPVLPENKYAANNLVLLIDVSSSMRSNHKFTLLQEAVNNLVMVLRPIDYVSVITYAGEAKTILWPVPGNEKDTIATAIQDLVPYGITRGVKGLTTAYTMAQKNFIKGGNNQIILATDGEFSEKNVTDAYYQRFISGYTKKGIKLSILGFGVNGSAIERMKKMTDAGKGSFILITPKNASKDVLINEIKKKSFIKN